MIKENVGGSFGGYASTTGKNIFRACAVFVSICPMSRRDPHAFPVLWRHYLRQEPSAGNPHAGICVGGAWQQAFLPRPYFVNHLILLRAISVNKAKQPQ